ncbi:MAG: phosphate regulon sensor histidine kinase PhoR [Granulosicoccus sp.]
MIARMENRKASIFDPPTLLKRELGWLAIGLVASLVVGAGVGLPLLPVAAFLLGFSIWMLLRMNAILDWLQNGAKVAAAPPTIGMSNRIVELVHREKKYSRKQKHRYRDTLAQFNSLADELPDATVVLDTQRQIRWANPAAKTILTVQPGRDRGQRIDNLIRDPKFHEFLQHPDASAELEIAGINNPERTISIRNVPSSKKMSILIARDVTQRVKVREMRRAFVGDVSHELRTPLTVIEGYLELLREDHELSPAVQEALDHMAAQSDRMRHIVEHLLQLSKLEGNPLGEQEGDAIAVALLLQSQIDAQRKSYPKHDFRLDVDNALSLLGTEGEIYSACQNLIVNAAKYSDTGSLIEVSWRLNKKGQPLFRVTDNGPGIEARHIPRLSERFYRVDKGRSRDNGGTGLGLAIVKHVAQRHGGQLLIESTPGEGSTFRIEFPANRALPASGTTITG